MHVVNKGTSKGQILEVQPYLLSILLSNNKKLDLFNGIVVLPNVKSLFT